MQSIIKKISIILNICLINIKNEMMNSDETMFSELFNCCVIVCNLRMVQLLKDILKGQGEKTHIMIIGLIVLQRYDKYSQKEM